jgi:hypothetical protein
MANSCFWNALCAKVPYFKDHGFTPGKARVFLQQRNRKTAHVKRKTRHSPLKTYREQQMQEHFQWRATAVDTTKPEFGEAKCTDWTGWQQGGHETSVDDPFLALLCELFPQLRIVQRFHCPNLRKQSRAARKRDDDGSLSVDALVTYEHASPPIPERVYTIQLNCSGSHVS